MYAARPMAQPRARDGRQEHHIDLTARPSSIRPRNGSIPATLYGRDSELDTLRRCLGEALRGGGRLALVAGEAGIGKTTLVARIAQEAQEQGALVLSGQCYDLTTTPPYGPWVEILRGYVTGRGLPELPDALTSPSLLDSISGQDALFAELSAFLLAVAETSPLVLLLEDQHWADADSLEFLRSLARQLPKRRVLLLVTYRDNELTPGYPLYRYLPALVREAPVERVMLRRLGAEAVHLLTADRFHLPEQQQAALVAYLQRYAEGNPFFTDELLRALAHDSVLQHVDGGWVLGDPFPAQLPTIVKQVIHARVAELDDDAQRMLQIAAVIGVEVPLRLWTVVSDERDELLDRAVEQALTAQLMEETPDRAGLQFTHALVRETLYAALVLPRRRTWHRRIAEALVNEPNAEPITVAHHFLAADDARAALWLVRAGDWAVRANATLDAVGHYERALQLLEDGGRELSEQARLLCTLAETYRYTDPRRALDYLGRAQDIIEVTGDRALGAVALWSRARVRGFLGESTREDLRQATDAWHALADEDRLRVLSLGQGFAGNAGPFAQWLAHQGRYGEAIEIGEAVLAGYGADPPARHRNEIGHALFALGLAYAGTGRPVDAGPAFERACRHFRGVRNHFIAAASLKWQIVEQALPYSASDPDITTRLLADYAAEWNQTKGFAVVEEARTLLPVFQPLVLSGAWDDAYRAASSYQGVNFLRIDALVTLGEVERLRGRWDNARAWVDLGLPHGPSSDLVSPFFVRFLALHRLGAALALDRGRHAEVLRWLECHEDLLDWSGRLLDRAESALLWARYYAAMDEPDRAFETATRALAVASDPLQPLSMLAAHRLLGELEMLRGQYTEAGTHLERSLALAVACAAPFERALTLLSRAELLVAQHQVDDARSVLAEVAAICGPLGAQPALDRMAAIQTRLPAQPQPGAAPGGLSPREIDVLRLVARGMTDIEVAAELFISPRTVAHHLQSIYNKLGISSRTAAAMFAFEHGLT